MSADTRALALAAAVQLKLSPVETVATAKVFDAYLSGEPAPAATKPATKPASGAKKPTQSEEEVVKAALEKQRQEAEAEGGADEGADEPAAPTEQDVALAVAKLLKANKRKEAIALLKKYGATSASGVKPKDRAKFVAEVGTTLEPSTDENDLTA